jgi:HK97 family phage prohead protease
VTQVASLKTLDTGITHDFRILKTDDLHIGGYASIEIVDKQNDLITLEALTESVLKFMKKPKYRNVMTNHSNVQVGEVVKEYRDNSGRLWKTAVDDVGFFVVIKLRDDIEKAKEVSREIRKGSLRSFSIGGQALEKRKRNNDELGDFNEISKLELHEITICEKGINPEAKFDILKMDGENMSELSSAIEELGTLLKAISEEDESPEDVEQRLAGLGVKDVGRDKGAPGSPGADIEEIVPAERRSEAVHIAAGGDDGEDGSTRLKDVEDVLVDPDDDLEELDSENNKEVNNMTEEYADNEGDDEGDDLELSDLEMEVKGKPDLPTGQVEAGEAGEVIFDGSARNKHDQISVVGKSVWNGDTQGLDLTAENLEKAYAEFKAEQMEKLAYDDIKRSFEDRFQHEVTRKQDDLDKSSYDPRIEVNELKKQFGDLLDTLKDDAEMSIQKRNTASEAAQLDIPSYDDIAKMDWNEIHLAVHNLEDKLV